VVGPVALHAEELSDPPREVYRPQQQPALGKALGKERAAGDVRDPDQREPGETEHDEGGEPDVQHPRKPRHQGRDARREEVDRHGGNRRHEHQPDPGEDEVAGGGGAEVTPIGERGTVPLIPLVAQAPVRLDLDEGTGISGRGGNGHWMFMMTGQFDPCQLATAR
jgi:hypothetical protein